MHCPGFNCTLQSAAASSLEQAAASKNDYITLNSAFRSAAEQYVLWFWYMHGMTDICDITITAMNASAHDITFNSFSFIGHKCGISLAAKPGQSNHEGGRAIDTSNYNYWNAALSAHGWVHSYPSSDPVHFDYKGSPDISARNLLAFQRLWNRHSASMIPIIHTTIPHTTVDDIIASL